MTRRSSSAMDYGIGSSMAHMAVETVLLPQTTQHETMVNEASTAAAVPTSNSVGSNESGIHSKAFQYEMATKSMSSTDNSDTMATNDNSPLWKYVTKLEKMAGKRGNTRFQCNYCLQIYNGSYYRVKAHLLKISKCGISSCCKVNDQHLTEMRRIVEEAELRIKNSIGDTFEPRKRRATRETSLEKSFNLAAHNQLDCEIARMFYSAGLPFHLAKNPYYVRAFTLVANNQISDYLPPGYNLLRTTLLQQERANIERLLDPIKSTWKEKGVTIVCDGWTDAQRRPLINFFAVTESSPIFLRAVNCEGEYKDELFISSLIIEVIEKIGQQNVVQVITDNVDICKAAGMLIESKYSHIFWTPCIVHTLDIALKTICAAKNSDTNEIVFYECNWISVVTEEVMCIKNFIMQHSMRLTFFNEFVNLKMLAVADTRFASVIVMLRRFKLIKCDLQSMIISDKWNCYKEDDIGKVQFVKEKVFNDIWWDKIDYILSFTEPIYEMLKIANTDKPCLHLIYAMWDTMIEKVKTIIYRNEGKKENEVSSFYSVVHRILVDRWDRNNTHLYCLAHSLNPRYYSRSWIGEDPNHIPPYSDLEISTMRNKCLKRLFPNSEERRTVLYEYANFAAAIEGFGNSDSIKDRETLEPKTWWNIYGACAPILQSLALKLLGQPCSSSCFRKNWRTYSFINSMKRNKIIPQQMEDLVFVHNNLRLLSRKSPEYITGETKMWDVGGDAFDSFNEDGLLEIAELSLDEPDLEFVICTDDGSEGEDEQAEEENQ
ncbi:uncharacterized protein [Typha latifolia]|uniref:uncharacterized protein n=1 Tax=Typha latifolia TaxID=4733 RepID=UPI003C2C7926